MLSEHTIPSDFDDEEDELIDFESYYSVEDTDLNGFKDDSDFEITSDMNSDDESGSRISFLISAQDSENLGKKSSLSGSEERGLPRLNYNCLTTDQIYELMLQRMKNLQPIFNIPLEDMIILLQRYGWSEERLLEQWTDDMEKVLVTSGLRTAKHSNIKRGIKLQPNFMCHICCESGEKETVSLECAHVYCLDCYKHYIQDKLPDGKIITCMNCDLALRNEDIDKIMGDNSSGKLMLSSIKGFIQKHSNHYKWCPFVDCNYVIQVGNTSSLSEFPRFHISPYVICDNKHKFCFQCGLESHAPGDCQVADVWVKTAQAESANLNWVLKNTKECPKCGVNIEKNGGCNHMTCKSCAYEFCWICEGCWKDHGGSYYECTRFKKEDKNDNVESKGSLRKYTFYYRLFSEHENSAKLDWNLGQTVEQKVRALQENVGISWIESQFLPESIRALIEGRTTLKWSFPVAFYSDPSHNLTKIFVDNQFLLVNAVEDLSQLLQIKEPKKIMEKKLDFYNKARFVKSRENALIECGRDLLCKGICIPQK